MFYSRAMAGELLEAARSFPIVTVMGPRQSGKTTLCRQLFKDKAYVNLEAPDTRERIAEDPRGFLERYPEGAVIDEIQQLPELLSYLQVVVDESDKKGMFILTGNHQLQLQEAIAQSLAGRSALLTLLPLSLSELEANGQKLSLDEALLRGGYPRLFKDDIHPTKLYRSYFQTYIERDVRQLIQLKELAPFQQLIKLCAGRIGQAVNFQSLSNEVAVSSPTIHHWISILEASYVLLRLQPYHENFGKRIIKSPKLYFLDVGLASYLLGIETVTQMERDPLRSHLVENLVFLELMKWRLNRGAAPQLYYYRDVQGHEVDFVFQCGHELVPIEVKASQTFKPLLLKNLYFFEKLLGSRCRGGALIYGGDNQGKVHSFSILNFADGAKALEE